MLNSVAGCAVTEVSDRPSVLMWSDVRTRANRVALNMTVPSVLRGMFIDTRRYNVHRTTRYTASWLLRHAALTDYGLSQRRSIFAGEMYSTISVEWAVDHFGLGLA